MIILINNTDIEYTARDTFAITITAEQGAEFGEGSTLTFVIAQSESSAPVVQKTVALADGRFCISLTNDESAKLSLGSYIYKLTLTNADGTTETQKSGEFLVKWGA